MAERKDAAGGSAPGKTMETETGTPVATAGGLADAEVRPVSAASKDERSTEATRGAGRQAAAAGKSGNESREAAKETGQPEIQRATDKIESAARRTSGALRDSVSGDGGIREIAQETRGVAGQIVDEVREAAQSLLEDQKVRAAETVHSIAEALHRTAETMHRENVPIAQYADRAADRIDELSARFREQRWSDLLAEAEVFAHRQPTLFLVGAVAMGFVVGRFMAASAEHEGGSAPASRRVSSGVSSAGGERDTL